MNRDKFFRCSEFKENPVRSIRLDMRRVSHREATHGTSAECTHTAKLTGSRPTGECSDWLAIIIFYLIF